jgi:hypothetical protein
MLFFGGARKTMLAKIRSGPSFGGHPAGCAGRLAGADIFLLGIGRPAWVRGSLVRADGIVVLRRYFEEFTFCDHGWRRKGARARPFSF